MNVGDRVTVVWGFPPETWVGIVEALPDRKGLARIRPQNADPGAYYMVPIVNIDLGTITYGHRHRATDPETARLAAIAAERHLTDNQWKVLKSLVEAGRSGLLDHDHEARNGLKQDTAGKRRGELQELGLVEPTGERRHTPRRSLAGVYRATPRGIAAYQERQRGAA